MEPVGDYSRTELLSLVLTACHIPHEIQQDNAGWSLLIPEDFHEAALHQLALFEEENQDWPPPEKEVEVPELAHHFPWIVFSMGCLMVFHAITGPWDSHSIWFSNGAVSGRAVLNDWELWRLVTGLTLHSGPVHLVGNVLIGGFLLLFLCGSLGFGMAWWLSMVAGILGNGLNVFFKGAVHLSVGYSTTVFGIIGILVGLEMKREGTLREIVVPLGAGFALLAMLGSEGERTDLGAHWWGLAVGVLGGIFVAHCPGLKAWARRPIIGAWFFGSSLCLMIGCWVIAMLQ